MASILRSPKSGSDWSAVELLAYHINIKPTPPAEFYDHFGANPSLNSLDPAILTTPVGLDDPSISDLAMQYLGHLDLATRATQFIVEFARETLFLLGFADRGSLLFTHYNIPLTICGETDKNAQAGVVILHRPIMILLVLLEDEMFSNPADAQARVIAAAIAAYQFNNSKREARGLQRLDNMTIPCITMSGTRPTFYLVPVSEALSIAVMTGQYPQDETKVLKCVTVRGHQRASEGMETLEYRWLALQRFLAFKALAKSHWATILDGFD
ncbi:hypothetical protein BYT27DRAFT_6743414 [Phlegmacium glaucopus]|nr:hypothetical protein BYT27DRAFT_6743414 [Phlegmacium glaucopus]